uniref:ATP-dependent zinc metalloprotease FTSH 5, mitochondrial n=1 Tax=Lygus hesperus TaxID=30085 RepID=A0A0A9WYP9_LYGHE
MFVGLGARRVRELFASAKKHSPALIFIDEIDALGGKRNRSDHSATRMTLNQLLAEMDGFQSSDAVVVLAATNTQETLDKALLRPGRFDTTISVDPPDMKGRAEVLQIYLDKIKACPTISAEQIARETTGFTGAELSNLVNMAAIHAAVFDKSQVTLDDIEYAKDRVSMGS